MRTRRLFSLLALLITITVGSCSGSKENVAPLTVDFSYTPDNSSPNKINFTANITGSYDIIRWTIEGGETITGSTTTSQVFAKAGTYKVTLSAWKGLQEFKCEKAVTIAKNLLDFDFTATPDPQNPNSYSFSATINGTYEKLVWDLGNGTSTNDQKLTTTTYPQAGTYAVKLSVWAQNIRFDVVKSIVIAKNLVDVSITAQPNATDAYTYTFKANVTGTYSNISWTIRGKTYNNLTEVEAYLPFKGDYPVTLNVTSGSYTFTAQKTITIASGDPAYASKLSLLWSDDFSGSSLDAQKWAVETGIHVNNELQTYTSSGNYSLANGVLTITCKKVNDAGAYGSYTSARLNTYGKKSFQYGRIEARLKLPKGLGTWPAFWMLGQSIGTGTSWPKCGEIDIMEYVGYDPHWVQGSLHSQDFSGGNAKNGRYQLSSSNDEAEWHTYGLVWTPDRISFYVDDYTNPYYTYNAPAQKTENNWPYDKPFFVLLNFAFGGDWGGAKGIDKTLDNLNYDIDYVKYYGEQ